MDLQDLRQRRMEMLDILKKAEKQFAMPPHEKLKVLTCFTLMPPRQGTHEDSNECSKIQVILVGTQFYVKDADEDLMHEVNHIYDTCFKAGIGDRGPETPEQLIYSAI